jgi:hypothetical protein
MHLFHKASLKLGLDYAVMHNMKGSSGGGSGSGMDQTASKDADGDDVGNSNSSAGMRFLAYSLFSNDLSHFLYLLMII